MGDEYDFPSYIADLMLASQKARKSGAHGAADALDDQLNFAVTDAANAGTIKNKSAFQAHVARRVIDRGGTDLLDVLTPH